MRVGVIGYGGRVSSMLEILFQYDLGVELAAIMDTDFEAVKKILKEYGRDESRIAFYEDADEMLDRERLDGVMIGTRCSTHTDYAVKVLQRNLPLFLEKPVSIDLAQLRRLQAAGKSTTAQTVVSFPLRVSPMVRLAKEIVDSGKIGTVEHIQAINNVPYGGVYYHSWYRDESITGGLFMQKATHDLDYIRYLMGQTPAAICAMESKSVFTGDKQAGLYCADCPEKRTCPEGPFVMEHIKIDSNHGYQCCYATDTGNHDSASVLLRFENGAHASYSQNFYARKGAAARGARLIGYKGTLEFDWYTDELKVFMHDASGMQVHRLNTAAIKHGGGDEVLALNFIEVMEGRASSVAPLSAGIESALMCLKARESAQTDAFVKVSL